MSGYLIMDKKKVNIASTHRFHLLDLARELAKQGYDVKFYSYVPVSRCIKYGLKKENCSSLFWLSLPFFLLAKLFPNKVQIIYIRNLILDYYMAHFMRRCDIYICLGSVYKQSITEAKRKFNAITILEWGSKHIIEQLKMFNKLESYSSKFLNRELESYQLTDYISISSEHVKQSFLKHGIAASKLLVNPYGVDLKQFNPTELNNNFDIIMVGGWRIEKGCDLLIKVCEQYHFSLLHVGSIINMKFPQCNNMTHIDSVDQKQLITYYSQAKVFVLPSRAEGLAMVQAQAIACGLPVVCSKETGGKDLKTLLHNSMWIIEMEELTVECLAKCIYQALELSKVQFGKRNYVGNDIENLTWEAYGKRYNKILNNIYYEF